MSIYFDLGKTLSYNKLFNFVVGGRGIGKTYSAKKWAIRKFLEDKSEFIYVRRYDTEFENIHQFFDDIRGAFPDHELEVKGYQFYIDGNYAGMGIPLSTSRKLKSNPFPFVKRIIFDEFIIDKGTHRYLKNEVEIFLDLYETVARMRNNVTALFLSNALSVTNPYFNYFNLSIPWGSEFLLKDEILLQMPESREFQEEKKKTRFAKLIDGTRYAKYSISNEFLLDNANFISERPEDGKYYMTLISNGEYYGCIASRKECVIFITKKADKNYPVCYALTGGDHNPNTLLMGGNKPHLIKRLINIYENGGVRFDCQNTKNVMIDVLKLG